MKTTMYYDGGCPVCMRGVRHWRRLDWARRIEWVDLMEHPDALAAEGIGFAAAMDVLHVRCRDGRLMVGVPAFAGARLVLGRFNVAYAVGFIAFLTYGLWRGNGPWQAAYAVLLVLLLLAKKLVDLPRQRRFMGPETGDRAAVGPRAG